MIKLRVFKKGPTYHRHTQKKTWAVFFLPVSRFLLLCPTQISPKKNETPPPTLDLVFIDTDLGTVERFVQTSNTRTNHEGTSQGRASAEEQVEGCPLWTACRPGGWIPDVPTGFFCRTYAQGIVLIPPPKKKKQEVMGVCWLMQLQSFLIKKALCSSSSISPKKKIAKCFFPSHLPPFKS